MKANRPIRSVLLLRRKRQAGIVIIMTLIALVILLITGVALIRSVDSTLNIAGNISFKRDLVNQADLGIAAAMTSMTSTSGTLYSDDVRAADLYTANYSSTKLDSNNQGIPLVLINSSKFESTMNKSLDITPTDTASNSMQVTIRYVIDRQCSTSGSFTTIKYTSCAYVPSGGLSGDSTQDAFDNNAGTSDRAIYRISVKVTGPHNTETYAQTTITR
jgi:type IV pilus assembly protein PilX